MRDMLDSAELFGATKTAINRGNAELLLPPPRTPHGVGHLDNRDGRLISTAPIPRIAQRTVGHKLAQQGVYVVVIGLSSAKLFEVGAAKRAVSLVDPVLEQRHQVVVADIAGHYEQQLRGVPDTVGE